MVGAQKVYVFTINSQLGCQTCAFLRWVRCRIVKSMHFLGQMLGWVVISIDFYDECMAGSAKVCIFTVGAQLGCQKYAFLR